MPPVCAVPPKTAFATSQPAAFPAYPECRNPRAPAVVRKPRPARKNQTGPFGKSGTWFTDLLSEVSLRGIVPRWATRVVAGCRIQPAIDNSAHPGRVAGWLLRKTMRRVLGKGKLVASARL